MPLFDLMASFDCCSCWARFFAACFGCGHGNNDRYAPSEGTARKALEAALSAWQTGKPHGQGQIEGTSPQVTVVDSKWRSGKKLKSGEVTKVKVVTGCPTEMPQ